MASTDGRRSQTGRNGEMVSAIKNGIAASRSTPGKSTGTQLTVDERVGAGRSLRQQVPRSSHGVWEPAADRVDPIALLQAEEKDRLPELVPVRYGRMLASPFTFYRATAALMAHDLATTGSSRATVPLTARNGGLRLTTPEQSTSDLRDTSRPRRTPTR